ncbi:succinate dehydrogenase/fumarate reductase flavo protein subunit [Paraphaeosphaeria sporulosa]|uniref:Succinate dehydrogenase/fumarate reductase flavo protein subunit n=1 Tax=Paraphaeosphaeria sporulosa TaxID=1460663 RepID=A0A177C354_9PLEO|nr:succinate dehydrogenase/fumarate reductase flavo protein subunit [Paraphaeosphaeria sporulosa]OAG02174.1 succinate dehydrogenase/fumarate reductase flavo protein subunit [Paraphaeosphaeria sporulosa]
MDTFDLIVVGSGFAGCMTALNFLETSKKLGKTGRVALIEVGKPDERCGASRWTMAYLRLDKDLGFDSDWKHEMALVSNGLADQSYCATLEREAQSTAKYVEEHGVKFNHHDEENVLLEFKTQQHFVFPEGGGKAIIDCLMGHIQQYKNAEVFWETEARHLLVDKRGAVRGLQVRKKDGLLYELHAPDVMLACGGFEGNREMLAKYVGKRTHELPLIAPGLKYNRGAGLNMALEVGAGTAGSFDGMHCELVDTRATKPDAVIWGHNYGIVVNEQCKRFYDEGKRHLFATFEMIALELWRDQNQKGYFITDEPIMKRFRPGWVYDTTDQEPEKANTIRELARKLKIDPDALEKTVNEFNDACNDKQFDLMKLDGKATTGLSPNKTNWANPINNSPYYGYPVTSHLTFTYGGVKTNNEAQVLSTNDVPIPGLWAAGELTGIFYNEYPPGTSVLRSLTFGRLAGTKIAEQLGSKSLLQSVTNTVRSTL